MIDQVKNRAREREWGDEGLTSRGKEAGLCGLTAKNSILSSDITCLPFIILTLTKKFLFSRKSKQKEKK